MKRFFFLLTLILLVSIHQTSYAETALYKHTADDLGIAGNHDIDECRVSEIVGDEVFLWTVEEGDSHVFKKVEFYLVDASNGRETKIPFTLTDTFVTDAHYSGQYIYILYHNSEDRQCILKIDKSGNVLDDFLLKGIDEGQVFYDVYDWNDERLFICGNIGVAEYDFTGEKLWYICFSPVVSYTRYGGGNRFYAMRETHLYEIDLDNNRLTGSREIEGVGIADMYVRDGNLYFFDNNGIRLCDTANETTSYVVNFADYGITSENYAIDYDGEKVRFVDYDPFDKNTSVTLHTVNLTERDTGKTRIEFAVPEYIPMPGQVYNIVNDFNRYTADYEVHVTQYGYREEPDTLSFKPDIVMMTDTKLVKNVSRVLDLVPYMDKSETLKPSELLPAVEKNYTVGGSLYMYPLDLYLDSFVFRSGDYSKNTLSGEDFLDYLESDGTLLTDYEMSKESILKALMEEGIYEFVDFDKGTCSFDSEAFKKLLVKINTLQSDAVFHPDVDYVPLDEGDRVLDISHIGTFDFFGKKRAVYGEDVKSVGIPAAGDGNKYLMSALCLAISADSERPDVAFEFMEYFCGSYSGSEIEGSIPAGRFGYDASVLAFKQSLLIKDFFGVFTDLKSKDIDEVTMMINNSVARTPDAAVVLDYVNYYANMYFNGEASVKVAAEDLQATVTKYLNR